MTNVIPKRIVLTCAGPSKKRWGDVKRHLIDIDGEPNLHRTIRLLNERGYTDIWVTQNYIGEFAVGQPYVPTVSGSDISCFYGAKELQPEFFMFGDVYFTEHALDVILNGNDNFYGRARKHPERHRGEFFALKMDDKLWQQMETFWTKYKAGEIPRAWSWDFYGYCQGKNFYKHFLSGNFTRINDLSIDFDSPARYEAFLKRRAAKQKS